MFLNYAPLAFEKVTNLQKHHTTKHPKVHVDNIDYKLLILTIRLESLT